MPIVIESLRKAEIPQFITLLRLGFAEDLAERGADPHRLARILRVLLLANGTPLRALRRLTGHEADLLTAKSGDRLVACLAILGRTEPVLTGMYVLPEFRGQQIALSMVTEALDRLRAHGHRRVTVLATDETAQRLAERAGFVPCDRTDLYQRRLPAQIPHPEGFKVQRRRHDLSGHPYDLGPLRRLSGVRSLQLIVSEGRQDAVACTLTALPNQRMGEIRPRLLSPGREEALLAGLAAGCEWIARLKREEVYLPLSADQAGFTPIARAAGFEASRSWMHLERDLTTA